jgi:large subunit ribosomal protein L9
MKLILKETVENLGEAGDVVSVKKGYGRNYLLPQGLAYEASASNMRRLEEEQKRAEERSKRDYLEGRRRASQFAGMVLVFKARAGEDGKLFGSVTNADVADRANETGKLDFSLDKRAVLMDEPLKSLGTFQVTVHLHAEVDVEIRVDVEAEEG